MTRLNRIGLIELGLIESLSMDCEQLRQQGFHLMQRQHVGPIAEGMVGIGVDFEKQAIDSYGYCCPRQGGYELPLAAAAAASESVDSEVCAMFMLDRYFTRRLGLCFHHRRPLSRSHFGCLLLMSVALLSSNLRDPLFQSCLSPSSPPIIGVCLDNGCLACYDGWPGGL